MLRTPHSYRGEPRWSICLTTPVCFAGLDKFMDSSEIRCLADAYKFYKAPTLVMVAYRAFIEDVDKLHLLKVSFTDARVMLLCCVNSLKFSVLLAGLGKVVTILPPRMALSLGCTAQTKRPLLLCTLVTEVLRLQEHTWNTFRARTEVSRKLNSSLRSQGGNPAGMMQPQTLVCG